MRQLLSDVGTMFVSIVEGITFFDVVDIIIVTVLIYNLLIFARQSRISQVFKGVGVILVAYWFSGLFRLPMLTWILNLVVDAGAVVLVILFQPELRRVLERLGRKTVVDRNTFYHRNEMEDIVSELTTTCLNLSQRRVGALIVLEQKTGLSDVIKSGVYLDAVVTAELLENIFEPNTPLHDGAVIVRDGRVIAAGCILPLIEDDMLSKELGTRHRAGLGVTENSDALVLIVSEESGVISLARGGRLVRYLDEEALGKILGEVYNTNGGEDYGLMRRLVDIARGKERP